MSQTRTIVASIAVVGLTSFLVISSNFTPGNPSESSPQWLAGDHHVHSRYSLGWDRETDPPTPILAGDAIYPIPMNALMGRRFGLDWMVSTDHGGPNHARIHRDYAYPELLEARRAVPDMVLFYGMEFDTPGADHSSIIVPYSEHEADDLYTIESRFAKREPWPADSSWDTEPRMLEALEAMKLLPLPPIVMAHHPSRSATDLGIYGSTAPAELRGWNDTAPYIAVGMEGSPGHQAAALRRRPLTSADQNDTSNAARGGYGRYPTMGGFDQMTAQLGGFWDSMLAEGRRWWISATSDSHVHWREGGSDFWPGEYSKTYILADKNPHSILESFRQGRVFVTTGDLISELWFTVSSDSAATDTGGTLLISSGDSVEVTVSFRQPAKPNFNGDTPQVSRVDLIAGPVRGRVSDPHTNTSPDTRVVARFSAGDWQTDGELRSFKYQFNAVEEPMYLRIRGTNTHELEPALDPRGEDPWQDLWFYSNPVFVELR
jgi:hypothetical protein